jgi:hypothetical protein
MVLQYRHEHTCLPSESTDFYHVIECFARGFPASISELRMIERPLTPSQDTCGPKLSGTGASIRWPLTEIHQACSIMRSPSGPP